MELKIYSKEGNLKLTASPDSNSAATCGIQEESVLALSFTPSNASRSKFTIMRTSSDGVIGFSNVISRR